MLGRLVVFTAGAAAGAIATWKLAVEPWYREWGVATDDVMRPLPGDDLVPQPSVVDTRSVDIAAPADAVWPWLVQMGYGRAGWYSYDGVDNKGRSSDTIVPEWQALAEGDTMPMHPGGGFRVAELEPGRALVLYLDGAMIAAQASAAEDNGGLDAATANVRATGAVMGNWFPDEFTASWAIVIEPLGTERSRLVERFRVHVGEDRPAARVTGPLMGFGMFTMMRKQMLGIRDRAERANSAGDAIPGKETPQPTAPEMSEAPEVSPVEPAEPAAAPA